MKPHSQTQLIDLVILLMLSSLQAVLAHTALPGCNDTCGNVHIPYPFGIGSNCSLDSSYEIECKTSPPSRYHSTRSRPFLSKLNVEVIEIVLDVDDVAEYPVQTVTVNTPPLRVCTADTRRQRRSSIDLRGSPYNFSTEGHVFLMKGCAGTAVLVNQSEQTMAGCATVCHNNNNTAVSGKNCYGVECCQTQLPPTTTTTSPSEPANSPLQLYHIDFYGQSLSGSRNNCMIVALIKSDSANQYIGNLSMAASDPSTAPVKLLWSFVSSDQPNYNPQAKCVFNRETNITSCLCNENHCGNPYVSDGCQGLSIGLGVVLLVIDIYGLYRFLKRRREMKRRSKFFKRNGGLLKQQQLSSNKGVVERTKIFTTGELEKATDHFNENWILGQEGQGTVYKGMYVTHSHPISQNLDAARLATCEHMWGISAPL